MSLCKTVAAHGRSRGLDVVLDAGSWKDGTATLLRSINIAICSNDFRPPGCKNENDVIDFLSAYGVQRVAITRGSEPILYRQEEAFGEIPVERVTPC